MTVVRDVAVHLDPEVTCPGEGGITAHHTDHIVGGTSQGRQRHDHPASVPPGLGCDPPWLGCDTMLIRSAVSGDVPALVELFAQWGHAQDETEIKAQLALWSRTAMAEVLVAEIAGTAAAAIAVVALPHLGRPGRLGRVMGLVVGHNCRRQGVGGALLAAAEERARGWDCDALELTSSRYRREAPAFYTALGFEDRSSRQARYVRQIR